MFGDERTEAYRHFVFDETDEYEKLIELLSEALGADPHNAIMLSNRGLAFAETLARRSRPTRGSASPS